MQPAGDVQGHAQSGTQVQGLRRSTRERRRPEILSPSLESGGGRHAKKARATSAGQAASASSGSGAPLAAAEQAQVDIQKTLPTYEASPLKTTIEFLPDGAAICFIATKKGLQDRLSSEDSFEYNFPFHFSLMNEHLTAMFDPREDEDIRFILRTDTVDDLDLTHYTPSEGDAFVTFQEDDRLLLLAFNDYTYCGSDEGDFSDSQFSCGSTSFPISQGHYNVTIYTKNEGTNDASLVEVVVLLAPVDEVHETNHDEMLNPRDLYSREYIH